MDEKPRTPEDWARLGPEVKKRRIQLGLTQPGLVAAGGPSGSVISRIEGGKPGSYDDRSILRLERALQWQEGSVDAILDGGEAVPVGKNATASPATVVGKAAISLPALTATSPPVSQDESTRNDAVLAYLQAMEQRQTELLGEIKELRRQVGDLQRQQTQQRKHDEPDKRASA